MQSLESVFNQFAQFLYRWWLDNSWYRQWLWFWLLVHWWLLKLYIFICWWLWNWLLAWFWRYAGYCWNVLTASFCVITVSTWRCDRRIHFAKTRFLLCVLECLLSSRWKFKSSCLPFDLNIFGGIQLFFEFFLWQSMNWISFARDRFDKIVQLNLFYLFINWFVRECFWSHWINWWSIWCPTVWHCSFWCFVLFNEDGVFNGRIMSGQFLSRFYRFPQVINEKSSVHSASNQSMPIWMKVYTCQRLFAIYHFHWLLLMDIVKWQCFVHWRWRK